NAIAGAIEYRKFVAAREPLDGAEVRVEALVIPGDMSGDARDALEAERLLAIIAHERSIDPQRRIAVLVRARKHLDALVAQIRRRQPELSFLAVEIERLAARQTVQDLLALTRALHHRADRVNWLAILRAPWCGLCLADLYALTAHDHAATVWQLMNDDAVVARLSTDGQQRLLHVRAVLTEAFAHQGRARLRRWVEGVWLKLGGAACLGGTADIADAQAFLDLLDELDAAGRFNPDRLDRELADLYAAPDALADGSLQFMTIHKSKGLEFDTVILPGLHRKGPSDDHELMLWEEVALEGLDEQLVAAPFSQRGRSGWPTPYEYLRLLERERSTNEKTRVLYVAVTRAIRRLYLVGVARRNAEGDPVASAGSFLDLLWGSVAGDFTAVAECASLPVTVAASPEAAFVPKLVRVGTPAVCGILQNSSADVPGMTMRSAMPDADTGEGDDAAVDSLAASIGTLLHRYLEMLSGSDLTAWDAAHIVSLQSAMRFWLMRQGHTAAAAKEGASRVTAALETTLASTIGRWLLMPHEDSAAELALSNVVHAHGSDKIANHVVDRCFIEAGQRWIVDYKTARLDDIAGDEVVWRANAERYREQLERYAGLFADEGLPLRLGIYYAMHGRLIELPFHAGQD
ncbi:MAG TPA: 3'-5' exonuclease, partial [Rhodocyclaceae bacterium]|nr:3'-5' exonuclease [Rhodocyclaceae bacterium]